MLKKSLLTTLLLILSSSIFSMPLVYTFQRPTIRNSFFQFSVLMDIDNRHEMPNSGGLNNDRIDAWLVSYDARYLVSHEDDSIFRIHQIFDINPDSAPADGFLDIAYDPDASLLQFSDLQVRKGQVRANATDWSVPLPREGNFYNDSAFNGGDLVDDDIFRYNETIFAYVPTTIISVNTLSDYYASVPEPGTFSLLLICLLLLVAMQKYRDGNLSLNQKRAEPLIA
ncbi:MAG: hypothetical protein P8X89_06585 [Reinekea sp.]